MQYHYVPYLDIHVVGKKIFFRNTSHLMGTSSSEGAGCAVRWSKRAILIKDDSISVPRLRTVEVHVCMYCMYCMYRLPTIVVDVQTRLNVAACKAESLRLGGRIA